MTAILANRSNESRRALDYYPTPNDVTEALLRFLSMPPGIVWEPACGDGAMSRVIERHGHTVISSDIRETGYGDGGIDFVAAPARQCDAIITNPPFNLAADFIERGNLLAPMVALLFKSQFWHAQKRYQLFQRIPPAWVLPLTWRPDFMNGERGGAPTMDVIWTVWKRGETDTRYKLLARP